MRAVFDDRIVFDEQADDLRRKDAEQHGHDGDEGDRDAKPIAHGGLQTLGIAARIVIADEGHQAEGDAHGRIERDEIDFIRNAHRGDGLGTVGRGEAREHGEGDDIEEILQGGRDADGEHTARNVARDAEMLRIQADDRAAPADGDQDQEIDTGDAVRQERGAARASRAHIEAPRQDENRVDEDVEDAAAHRADAGMDAAALGADEIGQHDV